MRCIAGFLAHGLQPACHARVLRAAAKSMIQRGDVWQAAGNLTVERADRVGGIETKLFPRSLGAITKTIPNLAFKVFFAAKQQRFGFAILRRD